MPYIIGIDEAGRGPLDGPLVVAGVSTNTKLKTKCQKIMKGIKDSKKLSAKKRQAWFVVLTKNPYMNWTVAKISPRIIDRINIAKSANLGAKQVFQKLSGNKNCYALLDGSLYLPKGITQKTIIKGDEKIPIISAASIIAKVTRDRLMLKYHGEHPEYKFNQHKGYGTEAHFKILKKHGPCPIHRKSFAPIAGLL